MRSRTGIFLLGLALGLMLLAGDVPEARAQKGGGGGHGGAGAAAAHTDGHYGGYHSGYYGGHYGYYNHYGHNHGWGYGGVVIGIGLGWPGDYGYYAPAAYPYPAPLAYPPPPPDGGYAPTPGYPGPSPSSPPPPAGPSLVVTINDGGFGPAFLDIKLGTTIRWVNNTATPRALSQPHLKWTGPAIGEGGIYTWTFSQPGEYPLQDSTNSNLRMTILVK